MVICCLFVFVGGFLFAKMAATVGATVVEVVAARPTVNAATTSLTLDPTEPQWL